MSILFSFFFARNKLQSINKSTFVLKYSLLFIFNTMFTVTSLIIQY